MRLNDGPFLIEPFWMSFFEDAFSGDFAGTPKEDPPFLFEIFLSFCFFWGVP